MHERPQAPVWGCLRTWLSGPGLWSLLTLPLPSSEILDPLGHPSQRKNGTSQFASSVALHEKEFGFPLVSLPLLSMFCYLYIGQQLAFPVAAALPC